MPLGQYFKVACLTYFLFKFFILRNLVEYGYICFFFTFDFIDP